MSDEIDNLRKSGEIPFRPYARLISVLGDQLISDKWIGVIELVKNSYDADAEKVDVVFKDYDTNQVPQTIEIRDNGIGMTKTDVLQKWMKPATPHKLNKKKKGDKRFTNKKRVMQGDKGVGRFAIYKLGNYVELFTKTEDSEEVHLTLDFAIYADDSFEDTGHVDKYLDEIKNKWEVNEISNEIQGEGTLLRISKLRNSWKYQDLKKLSNAFYRMMPPSLPGVKHSTDFEIDLIWNDKVYNEQYFALEKLMDVAPFYFEGSVSTKGILDVEYKSLSREKSFSIDLFNLNDENLKAYDIINYSPYKDQFIEIDENSKKPILSKNHPNVGSFIFFYYGFDLKGNELSREDVKKLRETSVYLFRDNVRVYPYGEIGDDWLGFSKLRAEKKASEIFSYNDLIGFVFITQGDNPDLRDSADREGLMNVDGKKDDFISLVSTSIKVMKAEVDVDKQKLKIEREKAINSLDQTYKVAYEDLRQIIDKEEIKQDELIKKASKLVKASDDLVKKAKSDVEITVELAGTGMAIEKATHDTMSLITRLRLNLDDMVKKVEGNEVDKEELIEFLKDLQQSLEFIYDELTVLSPLFRKARKNRTNVSIKEVAQRVEKYFKRDLLKDISFKIVGEDFTVYTNTGLVLQTLLNLMDNSIYWLRHSDTKDKEIVLSLDSDENSFVFADSGIGIDNDLKELVFSEFFSRKSDGRGLGLYIAKELLNRIGAVISVEDSDRILPGANIKVKFKE